MQDDTYPGCPAPTASMRERQRLLDRVAAQALHDMPFGDTGLFSRVLAKRNDTMLELLDRAYRHGSGGFRSSLTALLAKDEPDRFVREFMEFGAVAEPDDASRAIPYVRALHYYEDLLGQHEDYSLADERTKGACRALIRVTDALDGSFLSPLPIRSMPHSSDNWSTPVLSDKRLAVLAVDRPQDADRCVEIMMQRRTADMETVLAVLGHGADALSGGVL